MSHPDGTDGICLLCSSPIEAIARCGHFRYADGSGAVYSGRCIACDVDFILFRRGGEGEWHLRAPSSETLQNLIGQTEVDDLTRKLEKYKVHSAKWLTFLQRRRPEDDLWHFTSAEGAQGVAVVRHGRPISQFLMWSRFEH